MKAATTPLASATIPPPPRPRWLSWAYSRGVLDDQALVSRGMTLTVAERVRVLIIELRYGLPLYFAR